MKTKRSLPLRFLVRLAVWCLPALTHAQGTAFNYQGRLVENGVAATGTYDFIFAVYDAAAGGNVVAAAVPVNAIAVSAGQFAVPLDFGAGVFTGAARWLQISARVSGGAPHTLLVPRQALSPTPYAIFAKSAGSLITAGPAPAPGQFLSYTDGGNLAWTDPAVAAGNIFSTNGTSAYYNAGSLGLGTSTPTAGYRLEVVGATLLRPGNGTIQFGSPSAELGLSITPTAGNRADLRFNGTTLKLVAGVGVGPPAAGSGIEIATSGAVSMTGGGPGIVTFGSPNAESGSSIQRGGNRADVRFDGTALKLVAAAGIGPPASTNGLYVATSGNVGIGSLTPQSKLEVVGQDALRLVGYQPFLTLLDSNSGYARSRIQAVGGNLTLETESFVSGANSNNYAQLTAGGNFSVKTLTIRGGADLAEPFALSEHGVPAGAVVSIDADHPGKLRRSATAYDRKVAGIVSGANGIRPGISMIQEDALEAGENVALSGRVYVNANTSAGEIGPGDLLTTSAVPGEAMKAVDHERGQGAIIGKAMTALADGAGMVLVLVTLQ